MPHGVSHLPNPCADQEQGRQGQGKEGDGKESVSDRCLGRHNAPREEPLCPQDWQDPGEPPTTASAQPRPSPGRVSWHLPSHLLECAEVELVGIVPEEHLAVVVLVSAAGYQVQSRRGWPDDPILLQPGIPGIQDGLDHELKLPEGQGGVRRPQPIEEFPS